jgi:hypothetical protein
MGFKSKGCHALERCEHFAKVDILVTGVVYDVPCMVANHEPNESAIFVERFSVQGSLEHPNLLHKASFQSFVCSELPLDFKGVHKFQWVVLSQDLMGLSHRVFGVYPSYGSEHDSVVIPQVHRQLVTQYVRSAVVPFALLGFAQDGAPLGLHPPLFIAGQFTLRMNHAGLCAVPLCPVFKHSGFCSDSASFLSRVGARMGVPVVIVVACYCDDGRVGLAFVGLGCDGVGHAHSCDQEEGKGESCHGDIICDVRLA